MVWLLSTMVRFNEPVADPRPLGTVEDIEHLADRDDLNVMFILIDTLRADHLGAWGYGRDTSPTLDTLAASGVRFARQLSQSSWTKCSMASMWTSLYPTQTGVTRYDDIVTNEAVMPAERFQAAGFHTVGLYRNGWVAPTFGFEQGFDVYTRPPQRRRNPNVRAENPTISMVGTDEDTIAAGIEFLRVSGHDGRWFLYMHLMDVHEYLYDTESAIFGGEYMDKYDSSIRWTNGTLDLLFQYLRSFGLADKTLIVVAADHGEAFRERGLEGHARAVYKETTEVPFIIGFPFRLKPGLVIPTRTQNVDIWPTVFDLLGMEIPEGVAGVSRMPEILAAARGETLPDDQNGFAVIDETWGRRSGKPRLKLAVTEGPFRYVRTQERVDKEGEGDEGREELFDRTVDAKELTDVSSSQPEVLERLRVIGEGHLAEKPTWGEAPKRQLDEMELNQLRALGYAIP